MVAVQQREYHAIVRIAKEFEPELRSGAIERFLVSGRCLPPRCLEVGAGKLADMRRMVGRLEHGQLQSDGQEGFLLFGPYVPMDAGEYRLVIFGASEEPGSSRVDVVSEGARVEHVDFALSEMPGNANGVVLTAQVTLDAPAHDLEIRIYVGKEDKVQIAGYRLEPEDPE